MADAQKKITLAIDPGHGNGNKKPGVYDPGAVSGGLEEADIALAWGLTLKWLAPEYGFDVFMTRDDDRDPTPIGTRDNRANAAGAEFFLSLHCNCAEGQANGSEAYYRDSGDESLAGIALQACCAAMNSRNRGLKTEDESQHSRLAVLDFKGPAALLEIEFIDNAAARSKLTSRDRRIDFARRFLAALKAHAAARA